MVFPAHAGMIPQPMEEAVSLFGVPRTRGDDPGHDVLRNGAVECSPHTRG